MKEKSKKKNIGNLCIINHIVVLIYAIVLCFVSCAKESEGSISGLWLIFGLPYYIVSFQVLPTITSIIIGENKNTKNLFILIVEILLYIVEVLLLRYNTLQYSELEFMLLLYIIFSIISCIIYIKEFINNIAK